MIKKYWFIAFWLLFGLAAKAQQTDSLTWVKAKWKKNRLAPKIRLFQCHFNQKNLFSANENIAYLEVKNTGKRTAFAIAAEEKNLQETSKFGIQNQAIAAINGNFFDVKNGGSVDFTRVDGKTINTNRWDKNGNRAKHQQAAIVVENGKLALKKWDGSADWETTLGEKNVMLNGPLLTFNQQDAPLDTTSFTQKRHPRTCVGIKPNGRVILLVVDGRNENSAGMSLPELCRVMRWLGCSSSLNFDGGGSTTLWVKDMPANGVVNYPTDNKKWDHYGERKVANALLIKRQ